MKISVIIATHNRPQILFKVLRSLARQTLSKEDFEVIAVEDFLSAETKKIIDEFNEKINIFYYADDAPGAGAKRNFGVARSKADIILFLDDDMIASPDLLKEHINYYEDGVDGVLGHIEEDKEVELNHFTRYLIENDLQNTYANINPENVSFEYFYTGNISLKKDVFNKLGGFDVKFKQYGFEDTELGYRMNKTGYIIKYNKRALGYHHFSRNFEEYLERKYLLGKSAKYFAQIHPELKEKLSIHPRKLKEILLVNGLTKNYWLNKVKKLENTVGACHGMPLQEKEKLYKIYEYLLNYYYKLGTRYPLITTY